MQSKFDLKRKNEGTDLKYKKSKKDKEVSLLNISNTIKNPSVKSKIKVLALNIENLDEYDSLSGNEKIDFIVQQIHKKCEELKTNEKGTLWLFTAPEYLITESQPNQPVLPETKEYFIKKCMDLVAEFAPQLFLLPGTILTKKNINSTHLPKKLEQVHKYYSNLLEKFPALEDDEEFEKNQKHFKSKEIENTKNVNLVRNSAMFFSLSHGNIPKREVIDKKSPIDECGIEDKTYNLFQVAKIHSKKHTKANFNPMIELEHPFTKEKFNIGIEICKDHHNQILQSYLEKENTPPYYTLFYLLRFHM